MLYLLWTTSCEVRDLRTNKEEDEEYFVHWHLGIFIIIEFPGVNLLNPLYAAKWMNKNMIVSLIYWFDMLVAVACRGGGVGSEGRTTPLHPWFQSRKSSEHRTKWDEPFLFKLNLIYKALSHTVATMCVKELPWSQTVVLLQMLKFSLESVLLTPSSDLDLGCMYKSGEKQHRTPALLSNDRHVSCPLPDMDKIVHISEGKGE